MKSSGNNVVKLIEAPKTDSLLNLLGEAYEQLESEYGNEQLRGLILIPVDVNNAVSPVVCGEIDTRDGLFAVEDFKMKIMRDGDL